MTDLSPERLEKLLEQDPVDNAFLPLNLLGPLARQRIADAKRIAELEGALMARPRMDVNRDPYGNPFSI